MSDKKIQHFVPKFYFRQFSKDGNSVCLLIKKDGHFVPAAPIRHQASKDNFYGNKEIEELISKIEGGISPVLKKLVSNGTLGSLSDADMELVLISTLLQYSRTLKEREFYHPMFEESVKMFLEVGINNDESLTESEKRETVLVLEDLKIDPLKGHLETVSFMLQSSQHIEDLFPVLLINKTNRPFIFSDAPVIFHNAYMGEVKSSGVTGLRTAGLQIIYPLSSDKCLLLVDKNKYQIKQLIEGNVVNVRELKDIQSINLMQIHSSDASIYFSDAKFKEYVYHLWKGQRKKFKDRKMVKEVFKLPSNDASVTRELEKRYSHLLPVNLNLSFLKHEVLNDSEYLYFQKHHPHMVERL
ncbi:MAG: hypothetical protein CMF25_04005 [Kangiellaceae bacterium]|nr:hypothetical protein [Kangiellaceae bacterium]|tara:strand:+ start:5804 stop:6868 length:1065 start_codon:yes stop_codon:yes gene_type:complete